MALWFDSFIPIDFPMVSVPIIVLLGYVPGPGLIKEFLEVFGLCLLLPNENFGIDF